MSQKQKFLLKIAGNILKIVLGSAIFAVGIQCFYHPAKLASGGVTGIAMIVNYMSDIPVGITMLVLNIPIFILGLKHYGWRFMIGSLLGLVSSSTIIDLLGTLNFSLTTQPLLAALYGGILAGLGLGIVYTSGATTGGTDIVIKLIRGRYPYINFGTVLLLLDAAIILTYALLFREYEKAMYTVIAVYIEARMIDLVLYGSSQSKLCHIISEYSEEIKTEIVRTLNRGVTVLQGKGAYSGADKQVLLCVVKRQQIVEIKKLVKNIDSRAFVIVTDARDVFGEGFGDIRRDR